MRGGGGTGAQRSPFPERDVFVPARGGGVVPISVVTLCVRACVTYAAPAGFAKREIPLNPVEQEKADLAYFCKSCIREKPPPKPYVNLTVYCMFCGARKKSRNASEPELSCSIGINGFRRVTRFSRKLTPGGLKHIQLCRIFACIPGKVENWQLRILCFVILFLVF